MRCDSTRVYLFYVLYNTCTTQRAVPTVIITVCEHEQTCLFVVISDDDDESDIVVLDPITNQSTEDRASGKCTTLVGPVNDI